MPIKKKSKLLKLLVFSGACVGVLYGLVGFSSPTESQEAQADLKIQTQLEKRLELAHNINGFIRANQLPEKSKLTLDKNEVEGHIKYTINPDLQKEADRLLKSYKPDYGAIFMMDAATGEVLAMSSFQRDDDNAANWNLQASFPAASVFKVVTATAAVDKAGISPEDKIHYNGGAYTLYKKNVLSDKVTRWTNVISLKNAFARSINTAFGRLSIENLDPADLNEYATRFMFNQEIPTDFGVDMGVAYVPPGKGFELAEAASGYNKSNRMSPVQGAMIAAAVANDGQLVIPYMIESVANNSGDVIYQGETLTRGTIMTAESSRKVREMMEQTVIAGTSRRSFRPIMRDRKFRELEMGGKTGHLTGDNPRGRTDWFVGYAMVDDRKVAVAAVTVNKKFWTVKSAHLGQSMFMKYFKPIAANKKVKDHVVTAR